MKLACEGCDDVVEGETADSGHAGMRARGDEAHSKHFDGKRPDEIRQMRQMMDSYVRQMIADQN